MDRPLVAIFPLICFSVPLDLFAIKPGSSSEWIEVLEVFVIWVEGGKTCFCFDGWIVVVMPLRGGLGGEDDVFA